MRIGGESRVLAVPIFAAALLGFGRRECAARKRREAGFAGRCDAGQFAHVKDVSAWLRACALTRRRASAVGPLGRNLGILHQFHMANLESELAQEQVACTCRNSAV